MDLTYVPFKSQRRFGVEIEVNRKLTTKALTTAVDTALSKKITSVDRWGYSCNNKNWIVKPDSSCGDTGNKNNDGGGYEIVSAVGRGSKHLLNIDNVTQALLESKAQVNPFCGLHCQVEIKDFNENQAAILLAYWCKIEDIMSQAVPQHRRGSYHCVPHTKRKMWSKINHKTSIRDFWEIMRLRDLGPSGKRNTITLVNYQRTNVTSGQWSRFDRPTVELRYPESSLYSYDVKNWARLFVHFVEHISTAAGPANYSPSNLQDCLAILGLDHHYGDSFGILSPGLHETCCWFLFRLYKYASTQSLKAEVLAYYKKIVSEKIKWPYDFSQVNTLSLPKEDNVRTSKYVKQSI